MTTEGWAPTSGPDNLGSFRHRHRQGFPRSAHETRARGRRGSPLCAPSQEAATTTACACAPSKPSWIVANSPLRRDPELLSDGGDQIRVLATTPATSHSAKADIFEPVLPEEPQTEHEDSKLVHGAILSGQCQVVILQLAARCEFLSRMLNDLIFRPGCSKSPAARGARWRWRRTCTYAAAPRERTTPQMGLFSVSRLQRGENAAVHIDDLPVHKIRSARRQEHRGPTSSLGPPIA